MIQTGDVFGRWTALRPAESTIHKSWVCRCICGNEKIIREHRLLHRNKSFVCRCASNPGYSSHGLSQSPEYGVWQTLKDRVLNPAHHKYPNYGGRGIRICDRWLKFENFIADMGRRPGKGYSIERKDNDGDYCPENCVWVKASEQARNRRNNRNLTLNGSMRTLTEWCELYGMAQPTVRKRLKGNWALLDALTRPVYIGGRNSLLPSCL